MNEHLARTTFLDLKARDAAIGDDELDHLWSLLRPATIEDLLGEWSGGEFDTGNRFNGGMARIGWFGKTFRSAADVEPLVCLDAEGNRFSNVDFGRGEASLWIEEFRGEATATMVYDGMPTHDHFKVIDDRTVMGIMNGKGMLDEGRHLYFYLERLGEPRSSAPPAEAAAGSLQEAGQRFEVQRLIRASSSSVFDVLTDPAGHVAIDSSGMLVAADGSRVGTVGDCFVVHMDREALGDHPFGEYDVTVTITAFEPQRHLEWSVSSGLVPPLGHRYGYRLETVDGGTLVTSYYDWSAVPERYRRRGFPVIPEATLRASLGILARTVARTG